MNETKEEQGNPVAEVRPVIGHGDFQMGDCQMGDNPEEKRNILESKENNDGTRIIKQNEC